MSSFRSPSLWAAFFCLVGAGAGLLPWVEVSFFDQTLAPKPALSSWHGIVTTSVLVGSGVLLALRWLGRPGDPALSATSRRVALAQLVCGLVVAATVGVYVAPVLLSDRHASLRIQQGLTTHEESLQRGMAEAFVRGLHSRILPAAYLCLACGFSLAVLGAFGTLPRGRDARPGR